jgi:glutathione peroxidase
MTIYDFNLKTTNGETKSVKDYAGQAFLVVNTATGCGFTPQYEGLEQLYEAYRDKGFEILDLPCNQFGNQAPGSNEEVAEFCQLRYNTTFQTFAKIEVNGAKQHPLYTFLKSQPVTEFVGDAQNELYTKYAALLNIDLAPENKDIKWNFTKFLVDQKGTVLKRYDSTTEPAVIAADLDQLFA